MGDVQRREEYVGQREAEDERAGQCGGEPMVCAQQVAGGEVDEADEREPAFTDPAD